MNKNVNEHFRKVDPILYAVIEKVGVFGPKVSDDHFSELCEIIINQQLSDKAAATIFGRFRKLFPQEKITPQALLKLAAEKIRSCGTSNAKVSFLKDLAAKVLPEELRLDQLNKLSDDLIIKKLTKVKGIGPWSAEMFLMFSLGRDDVFSHGDLGLRNAIKKLYKFKKEPTKKQIEKIVEKWKPYRTYACRILWKSLEIK
ncbi:hypothetical protein A3B40_04970 [Candidatus Roizmanbacteria bacterium RIFCSPLOWO2_01_FULL_37_16]|uniref:DNA-3-methyladenine glycosylase II n=1 Tax=Candidatus Roizmanbacteria bacterium RIFCSPLOWO2_01_FULL_37_16 TaxID=1802058 RepID=A0A1F7IK26_9BACT|nr:MAG: hypothetical protein A2859_04335 [Candidatus Roizmanbacteria bacterium RIFCSPHIGHO2_01_FULL_37_16b]OGK32425.1 MAG: hypothetical protein A3F57_04985 [Candidatus Roizmanbacteria bacterium RIFCSPHIGHO2_12_FULL_36_11]OGK43708.1 MAG: hypothetical protein A3B40_04970 [Candidatus Roizmanbacteria bacterium RIFCSPLOWO2_01_FULL_37_16]